jgi:flagellar hook-length control protein FliK
VATTGAPSAAPPPAAPPPVDPAGAAFSVVVQTATAALPTTDTGGGTTGAPAGTTHTDAAPAIGILQPGAQGDSSGSASDSSGAASDGSTTSSPTPPQSATDTGTVFSVPTLAPASATAPAVDGTAPVAAGDDAPVAAQLGRQLAVLTNAPDGSQTMTLVVTPDDLGPVSIQATVTGGNLDLTLHGAHEHGRHALVEALPDLRRDLEAAGIALNRLEVGADADGDGSPWARAAQQQLADSRSGQQGRPGQPPAGSRSWATTNDHPGEGTSASTSDLSASSGVDVRV